MHHILTLVQKKNNFSHVYVSYFSHLFNFRIFVMTANLVFYLFKKAYPHRITQLMMHVFAWGFPTALSIFALAKRTYSFKESKNVFAALFYTLLKAKIIHFYSSIRTTWYPHTWTRRQEIDTLLPLICYFFLHADGLWGFAPATVSCYYNDSYVICHLCQYALRTVTDISDRRVSHLSDIAIFYPYVMLHGLSGLLSVFAVARLLLVRDIFFEIWMWTVFSLSFINFVYFVLFDILYFCLV